jgi:hypothetical protein
VIKSINAILKTGGFLIISIPTPLYPKYFGQEFAKSIGHVRDGYTLSEIERILQSNGFRILDYRYHTNHFSATLCKIYYRRKSYAIKLMLMPILRFLSYFNVLVSTRDKEAQNSCGIVLLAQKMGRQL